MSPFPLNPYHLLSQPSYQLIILLSIHCGNRIIRRELPQMPSPQHLPSCLHLHPHVLLSLWFPRPHSYLKSTLPALALASVPSSVPRHSSSHSAIPSLPVFSHFLPDRSLSAHRNRSIAVISPLLKTFTLISSLLLNICCLTILKK